MKPSEIQMLIVYADGGCHGNGTDNASCYGSFAIQAVLIEGTEAAKQDTVKKIDGLLIQTVKEEKQFPLPELSTNNQAEYGALLRALRYLAAPERKAFIQKIAQIQIKMDSELVVHQVHGSWKVKNDELKPLKAEAAQLIDELGADLSQVGRAHIVPVLGH